jgi:pimeloyl-ACP methyl ester carboxylesterase
MKILFIQGIHNFSLRERFVKDVSEATGYEVIYHSFDYGLFEKQKHLEFIKEINQIVRETDDRFIILAHSFGGILAHSLDAHTYTKVDRMITFATPHALPHFLLKRLTAHLPYIPHIPVPLESCGFYADFTVPFFLTKSRYAKSHRNYLGTHTQVMNRKAFFRNLILH